MEKNFRETKLEDGSLWYDYVTDIDYKGMKINLAEYGESREQEIKKGKKKGTWNKKRKKFWFITDLSLSAKSIANVVERGRMRWKIENEGFNTQKNRGYFLEHKYSKT